MINRAAKHIHLPQAAAVGVVHTLYAFFACFSLSASVYAQTTFTPGAAPLIARSTYLNAYSIYGNASRFPVSWPVYNADPQQIVGWSGLVRIDDATAAVSWLGDVIVANVTAANVSTISLTPTKTVVTMTAGPMSLNITFLSPIEPGDFVRQSIPFSYMTFECSSTDGNAHHVQIFTDISGEWLSGDRSQIMTWSTTVDGSSSRIYHTAQLKTPLQFSENAGQAQWGTLYHATSGGNGVTYRTGWADDNRNQFVAKGALDNSQDTNFRAISNNFPTLAFSNDLGSIKSTTKPVVFAVGFNRRPAVQYTDLTGTTLSRQLFYRANYTDADTLVNFVLSDYPAAAKRANQLDNTLSSAATSAGGADLVNLVSLTARQVFGSTEMTIGTGSNGKLNTSDAMMFMRGTNGASAGRVQPVEDLFAAWPLFMVVDPTLGGPLLEPLFRFQSAREYTVQFATQDLGTAYPNATGANNAHNQGIEQSANMIIMAYAHALFSGDGSVIAQYYPLLKTWANYLISHTLTPTDQISADGLAVANQTNLAVKGIIAINAMSKISTVLNNTADMQIFQNNASSLYTQWKSMALGSGNRMLLAYGNSNSWTLGYNLFADKWLGLNMVDSVIYSGQTTQFQSFISANAASTNFGLPTDSHDTNTITPSWNLLAAAYAPDSSVQSTLVNHILSRAALSSTNDGLPNQYNATTGARTAGFSSPALGATFGQIALKLTQRSITVPPSTGSGDDGGSSIIGPVVGGVVGGIAALCGVAGLLWFLRRRKQQRSRRTDIVLDEHIPEEREAPYKDHTTVPAPYMYSDTAASTSNGRSQSAESVDSSTPALRPDGWGEEAYSDLPESHSDSNGTRTTGPLGLRNPWPRGQEQELRAVNVDPDYVESASSQAPNPPLSSKLIAEMRRTRDASPAIGTAAISTSPRPAGSSVASPSQSEDQAAAALREEVANLRREMEEIRMERVEAPPRYDDA